jgi:hypothetical protein
MMKNCSNSTELKKEPPPQMIHDSLEHSSPTTPACNNELRCLGLMQFLAFSDDFCSYQLLKINTVVPHTTELLLCPFHGRLLGEYLAKDHNIQYSV